MASTDSIRELAEPVLASAGLELWDVEITRDVVRIMVERPAHPAGPTGDPQGVDLDTLSVASGALSPLLDSHPDVVPEGRYQLEVSSPGIERTLRTPDQFRRYLDAEITVKTLTPVEGGRRHRGRLLEVSPDGIVLAPAEGPGTRLELGYDQIDRARTVLVWGPGSGRPIAGRTAAGRQAGGGPASMHHNPKDAGS